MGWFMISPLVSEGFGSGRSMAFLPGKYKISPYRVKFKAAAIIFFKSFSNWCRKP